MRCNIKFKYHQNKNKMDWGNSYSLQKQHVNQHRFCVANYRWWGKISSLQDVGEGMESLAGSFCIGWFFADFGIKLNFFFIF